MNGKKSSLILSLFFAVAAAFLCPISRPFFGYDMTDVTDAVRIYFWTGTILFMLLMLTAIPKTPEPIIKGVRYGIAIVLILISIELVSSVAYRALYGKWAHTIEKNQNRNLFRPHPYLVGSPVKNIRYTRGELTYTHNRLGFRGEQFPLEKPAGKTRVVTIGGSTTYGVGVNDEETWPYHLSKELGADFHVINMGVPGYSSAENLIQTERYLAELQPALAIYLIGLNDLRNINIEGLKADYSDFHRPSLYGAFGLCENENLPPLASVKLFVMIGQQLGLIETCPNQAIDVKTRKHRGMDEHAFSIYVYNLNRIVEECRTQGIELMFVPQILLEEVLKTGDYSWWIPYVPTEKMDDMMWAYNMGLKAVAKSNGIPFASEVLEHNWQKSDFVDLSHFNNDANLELAQLIARKLRTGLETDSINKTN